MMDAPVPCRPIAAGICCEDVVSEIIGGASLADLRNIMSKITIHFAQLSQNRPLIFNINLPAFGAHALENETILEHVFSGTN